MGKKRTPAAARLAHNGLKTKRNRVLPSPVAISADAEFGKTSHKRALAWNNSVDLLHNLPLIGWMIRLDLSYTANFRFQARTPSEEFDAVLERHVYERSKPAKWDSSRRLSRDGMLRSFAMLKALHGDSLILKQQMGKLQLFEAWCIAKGKDAPAMVNDNGLVLNELTKAAEFYAIATGDSSSELVHRYLAPWSECIFQMSEVLPARPTQTRGESPLLVAMDLARDQLDNRTFRLLRSKIEAMFGIVIKRDHNLKGAADFNYNVRPDQDIPDNPAAAVVPPLDYEIKPGLKLEIEREDDASFLESKTPGGTWLEFDKNITAHILSCFDIPYTAFDGTAANYSSMRGDMNRYKSSIEHRREQNADAGHEMLDWALRADVASGALKLPKGMDYERDVDWELVPRATFILDSGKEIDAIIKKLAIGATTYAEAAKELGSVTPFNLNLEIQALEIAKANKLGVALARGVMPGAPQTDAGTYGPDTPAPAAPASDNKG